MVLSAFILYVIFYILPVFFYNTSINKDNYKDVRYFISEKLEDDIVNVKITNIENVKFNFTVDGEKYTGYLKDNGKIHDHFYSEDSIESIVLDNNLITVE
jgi:hypothetical protein